MDMTYGNKLKELMTNPGSFRASPGYKFAFDQGQEAINRKMAAGGMRGSGNALAALMQHGQGMASTEYGNQVDRALRASGQEQQYDLGSRGLDLGRDRMGLDRELGMGRLDLDRTLGTGKLAQDSLDSERNFGLGMYRAGNDFSLGQEQNANTAQRNAWDFDLGMDRNNIARAEGANNYSLGNRRLDVDWMNANTNRGAQRSNDYYRGRESDLEWLKYQPRNYY